MKRVRGYIFSRPFMGERAPQHVQNIIIRDYCARNNLFYLLSSTEYVEKKSHLMLQQTLKELDSIDGIVAYSLFQLPEDKSLRTKVYKRILNLKKELHFSVENLKITKTEDIETIENIWLVRQTLPSCLKTINT